MASAGKCVETTMIHHRPPARPVSREEAPRVDTVLTVTAFVEDDVVVEGGVMSAEIHFPTIRLVCVCERERVRVGERVSELRGG